MTLKFKLHLVVSFLLLLFMFGGTLGVFATTSVLGAYFFHEFALIPTFILTRLPIGLIGLLLAAIFLAATDSIAGELNSLSTATVIDFYRRWFKRTATDAHYLNVSRIITGFWGLFACGVAVWAAELGSLIEVVNRFGSFFYGSILGVFILAVVFPFATGNGAFVGLINDMSDTIDLKFPKLENQTLENMRKILPPFGSPNNPLDVTAGAAPGANIGNVTITYVLDSGRFTKLSGVEESFGTYNSVTGLFNFDCTNNYIFYVNPTGNFTANLQNFLLDTNNVTSITMVINQGGTPYMSINNVLINGSNVANPSVNITLLPRQNSGSAYPSTQTGSAWPPTNQVQNPLVQSSNNYSSTGAPEYTIQQFTGQVYTRLRARQMAFKISSSGLGVAWQLGTPRLDIKNDGRR